MAPHSLPPAEFRTVFDRLLQPCSDPVRASGAKAYLKSPHLHLGVGARDLRQAARAFVRENPSLSVEELLQIAHAAFEPPPPEPKVYDHRALSVAILELRARDFPPERLPALESLFVEGATWALVDWLAIKVAGPALWKRPDPELFLHSWAVHPNIWVRRASLLTPLDRLRSGKGSLHLLFHLVEQNLPDRSFWIQKAIGWVLRDCSRKRPAEVLAFAESLGPRLHGLARREALRNLPPPATCP